MKVDPDSFMGQQVHGVVEKKLLENRLRYENVLDLAQDPDERIRIRVAGISWISEKVLRLLAQDPSREVRMKVAVHPETPLEILNALRSDPDQEVRRWATHRPDNPYEISWPPKP